MSSPTDPFQSPVYPSTPQFGYPPPNQNQLPLVLSIGSLATGLMGFLSCACCIFMPLPLIAIVLGVVTLTMKPEPPPRVMAIIGIVCGALAIVATIGLFVFAAINGGMRNPNFMRPVGP